MKGSAVSSLRGLLKRQGSHGIPMPTRPCHAASYKRFMSQGMFMQPNEKWYWLPFPTTRDFEPLDLEDIHTASPSVGDINVITQLPAG